MRFPWMLAGLAAALAAAPAQADITARFLQDRRPVVIEVNDRGDCRVRYDAFDMLVLDGVVYQIEPDYVVRLSDVLASFDMSMDQAVADTEAQGVQETSDEELSTYFPPSPPPVPVQIIQGGTETVGGRRGTLWTIRHPDLVRSARDEEYVVSPDVDLAPLACAQPARPFTSRMDEVLPGDTSGAVAARSAIQRRGAIIRYERRIRLQSVDTRPIPASRFVLPRTPLTRAEYEANLERASSR